MPLSDEEIDRLGLADRIALARRLGLGTGWDQALQKEQRRARRRRTFALAITAVCSALLTPWIVYLAITLPDRYVSHSWALTWVGFDILLALMLGLTAFLAWKKRILVTLTAAASGVLLLTDAWFDITTANPSDLREAIFSAALIEVPLALFLIGMAISIVWRVSALLNAASGQGSVSDRWRTKISPEIVHRDKDEDD